MLALLASAASASLLPGAAGASAQSAQTGRRKPNILFILMDNLGYGEPGVYGGGMLRGAPTPRIDALAADGTRLTNLMWRDLDPQCVGRRADDEDRRRFRAKRPAPPLIPPGTPDPYRPESRAVRHAPNQ